MKTLWAVLFGMTAMAWTFEGDWSTWDKPGDKPGAVEEAKGDAALSYGTPGMETGYVGFYEIRTMGRSESRWMGSLEGRSPSLADNNGNSRFDWTRLLGRAEAHHVEGSSRTAPYMASDRAPTHEASANREFGCNLVEANRDEGRDEARDTGGQAGGSGEPPTTWEMDEDSERKAAATAAGNQGC